MDDLINSIKIDDNTKDSNALALDQSLITTFNKITDPTSVVRESEYERTPSNLSLANRFSGAFEKLSKGGAGLTKKDREALVFGAKVIADSRGSRYNEILSSYKTIADASGVKPEMVTEGFGAYTPFGVIGNNKKSNFGNRLDGSPKGNGFLGILKRPDGGVSTEISVGVNLNGKETEIPALVPTLSKNEIDYLLGGGKPTKEIIKKASEHAKKRIENGLSPFAENDEEPGYEYRMVNGKKQRRLISNAK